MEQHDSAWLDYFRARGYPDALPLAAGMEGAVYRLRAGTVAKVWGRAGIGDLRQLAEFYADLRSARLPFATPEIVAVEQFAGKAATIERELLGDNLNDRLGAPTPVPDKAAQRCILDVLSALASITPTSASRALSVLNESVGPWAGHDTWSATFTALIDRRVKRFGDQLRRSVDRFDEKYDRVRIWLAGRTPSMSVIHGDIFPNNIFVDDDLRPVGLLDFGFLSTAGDPASDASTACGIYDMYGPTAPETDRLLLAAVSRELGHDPQRLAIYRAAYAMTTSNAYDSTGRDGHFAWCCRMLNRADIVAALGL
jgi:hypothetical protein